jgi:uncharacterized protein
MFVATSAVRRGHQRLLTASVGSTVCAREPGRASGRSDRPLLRPSAQPAGGDHRKANPTGRLKDLRGHKYCVLVTYKQSGEPVPSALWFGTGNGKLYVQTGATAVKIKRIKRNPEVRVAPATSRDRPLAAPFLGASRLVPAEEEREAERRLQANYGFGRRMYSFFTGRLANVYVEVKLTPPG